MRRREVVGRLLGGARGWLLATALLLALTWTAGIALLALSGWFITATALAGAGLLLGLDIFTPSAGIRGAALLRTVARYGERVVGHEAVLRRLAELRRDTFSDIARLPLAQQRARRSGDWLSRLGADIDTLDAVPLRVVAPALAAIVAILSAVALAWILAPAEAGWLLLVIALLVGLATVVAARLGRAHGAALVEGRSEERIALLDHVDGLAELTVYGRREASDAALQTLEGRQAERLGTQEAVAEGAQQAAQLLVWLGSLLMLALALGWFSEGRLSAPLAVLLPLMTLGLGEALASLPGAGWRLGESVAAVSRLALPDGRAPHPAETSDGVAAAPARPQRVELRSLSVGFDRARPLLRSLDLVLEPGRPLVLHGPSGSGKSALLATLGGELAPLGGEVLIRGQSAAECPPARIALLAQDTVLLDASVLANLRLARSDLKEDEAGRLLCAFGLDAFAFGGRRGVRARVGEGAGNLSGGQARRVLLAWLSLRDPDLALLDEPFSALDAQSEAQALAVLSPWLASRCSVIATHTPERLPAAWPRLKIG